MESIKQLIVDENNIAHNSMMGNSYELSPISKEIIEMMQENLSKEEIIEELHQRYEVSKHQLFIDIGDFISKLKIYGLYR
jgi:hypothetical protein